MRRRALLRTVAAGAAAGLASIGTAETEEQAGDIVAVARDRLVRFEEEAGGRRVSWRIENRHTGDEVFSLDFSRARVAHSYATDEHMFVALDTLDPAMSSRTVEWFVQSDMGRWREVHRTGETRIWDVYADGTTRIRR